MLHKIVIRFGQKIQELLNYDLGLTYKDSFFIHLCCIIYYFMKKILRELGADLQELNYLLEIDYESSSMLRQVALRRIASMHTYLDALTLELNRSEDVLAKILDSVQQEEKKEISEPENLHQEILAERLRPASDIMSCFSLNDTFRFSRELFGGDKERMNEVMVKINEIGSLDNILAYLSSELQVNEEDEVMADFIELLKKYFV